MDILDIIKFLFEKDSPVFIILFFLLVYLYHKILINPKLDSIVNDITNINKNITNFTDKFEDINMILDVISETLVQSIKDFIENDINKIKSTMSIIENISNSVNDIYQSNKNIQLNLDKNTNTIIEFAKEILNISNKLDKIILKINNLKDILLRNYNEDDNDDSKYQYSLLIKQIDELQRELKKKKEDLYKSTKQLLEDNKNLYVDSYVTNEEIKSLLKNYKKE